MEEKQNSQEKQVRDYAEVTRACCVDGSPDKIEVHVDNAAEGILELWEQGGMQYIDTITIDSNSFDHDFIDSIDCENCYYVVAKEAAPSPFAVSAIVTKGEDCEEQCEPSEEVIEAPIEVLVGQRKRVKVKIKYRGENTYELWIHSKKKNEDVFDFDEKVYWRRGNTRRDADIPMRPYEGENEDLAIFCLIGNNQYFLIRNL